MFLVNSHNPRFSATSRRSETQVLHANRHTFSRSYGVILPSSLTRVLSRALGYSPRPPESVCGTDTKGALYAAFLGSMGSPSSRAEARPHHLSAMRAAVCPYRVLADSPYGLERGHPSSRARPTLLRPRLLQRHPWWCRNINLLSITYASRPRLRYPTNPWEDYPSPGNLGLTATEFLARFIATHACISSSQGRYRSLPSGVYLPENTPLPLSCESP